MLAKFFGLNPKGPYQSLQKEKETFCVVLTYSIKRAREIGSFMSQSGKNVKKCTEKRDARAKLIFCQSKPFFFCCSPSPLQRLPIVVIQKFCYHGNVTSHFSSL